MGEVKTIDALNDFWRIRYPSVPPLPDIFSGDVVHGLAENSFLAITIGNPASFLHWFIERSPMEWQCITRKHPNGTILQVWENAALKAEIETLKKERT